MYKRLKRMAQAEYDSLCLPPRKIEFHKFVEPEPYKPVDLEDLPDPETGEEIIARQMAARHEAEIKATHSMVALRSLEAPLYWIGRQWSVTAYGVEEIKRGGYCITKDRLSAHWWFDHMKSKCWVDADDFSNALIFARELFKIKVHPDRESVEHKP